MDQQGGGGQTPGAGAGTQSGAQAGAQTGAAAGGGVTGEPVSTAIIVGVQEGKKQADNLAGQIGDAGSGGDANVPPPRGQTGGGQTGDPQVSMRSPEAPPPDLPEESA
jgi:hypothetical protein